MTHKIVVVVLGIDLTFYDDVALKRLPAWDKPIFVQGTADSIAALEVISPVFPVFVPADGAHSIQDMIDQRRAGLEALGIFDVDEEIAKAHHRIQTRFDENRIKQAILHLGGI